MSSEVKAKISLASTVPKAILSTSAKNIVNPHTPESEVGWQW